MDEIEIIKIVRSASGGEWYPAPDLSKDYREGWVDGWAMAVEEILDDLVDYFLDHISHDEIKERTYRTTIRRAKIVDKFTDQSTSQDK